MKKILSTPFATLIIMILLVTACKKETVIHSMQAKVDGLLVLCDSSATVTRGLDGTLYGIDGAKTGGIRLKLLFPIGKGTGTYPFLGFTATYQNEGWVMYGINSQYKSTDGSVTITEVTGNRYKGTFSFQAKSYAGGVRTVTDGSFDISY